MVNREEKTMEEENVYQKAIDKWGEYAQLDQMIEEMSELTIAISKYKRYRLGEKYLDKDEVFDNLYEELADVRLCLHQLEYMFGEENVDKAYDKKFQKFMAQLTGTYKK